MTYAEKDLSTLHDCQDVLERALIDAKAKIEDKLAGLTTENGKALYAEFESTLEDHTSDVLGDTLDAWAISKRNEIEDETPYERPAVPPMAAE